MTTLRTRFGVRTSLGVLASLALLAFEWYVYNRRVYF